MNYNYLLFVILFNTTFFCAMEQAQSTPVQEGITKVIQELKSIQICNQPQRYFDFLRNSTANYLDLLSHDLLKITAEYYVHERARGQHDGNSFLSLHPTSGLIIPHALSDYHSACHCLSCDIERRRKESEWDTWKSDVRHTAYTIGYYGSMAVLVGGMVKILLSLKPEQQDKLADRMIDASVDLLKKAAQQAAQGAAYVPSSGSAPIARQVVDQAMVQARRVWPILQQRGINISFEAVYAMVKAGIDPLTRYAVAPVMGWR